MIVSPLISHLKHLWQAARYSMQGLDAAYEREKAFQQEIWLGLILVPVALFVGDTGTQRAVLIGSLGLILIAELLNSAIEAVVDRIGSERSELSGRAKDLGSAAVFVSIVQAILIWLFVLFEV